MEEQFPSILLMRLKPRLPNGALVGETNRVCHLVAVPEPGETPEVLRAYCGAEILPGSAELLGGVSGMPCEGCLARSPIPAFAMLRVLPVGELAVQHPAGEWSDRGLSPEQKLAMRFVLLLLLQDPARPLSVAEIADRLRQDPDTVNLITLLHVAVGWVQRWWAPDEADQGWTDCLCRLTEHGIAVARRLLARDLTPTFTALAGRLDLDITVIFPQDRPATRGPGGCNGADSAAPTGLHPDSADDEEGS